jgi:hypothetical protein
MEGWVNGAGRTGIDAGPDGGARLIAPGGSGTDAGGTGGGRSVNIWADTPAGRAETSIAASASVGSRPLPRPEPWLPLPPEVMAHAFH